jgi:hypothetical protein
MKGDWSWKPTEADVPKPREPVAKKSGFTKKQRAKWHRKAMNAQSQNKPRTWLTGEQKRHLRDI